MQFCYVPERDSIRNDCNGKKGKGWTKNYQLYGGTNSTCQTITLYSYFNYNNGFHSTNLFLNNSINISNFLIYKFSDIPSEIFIPGKFMNKSNCY